MERHKSHKVLWYQSPCRHSITNKTNHLDSHGQTPMYLMHHHAQWLQKLGHIDFISNLEAQFVTSNQNPNYLKKKSIKTTHDCLKHYNTTQQFKCGKPSQAKNLPTVPSFRKPHGHKILKLNLSLHEIEGGPAGQLNTSRTLLSLVKLAIFYHDTLYLDLLDESEDPRKKTCTHHALLLSFQSPTHSNVQNSTTLHPNC